MGSSKKGSSNHPGLYWRGRYWWLTSDPLERRAISTRCTNLKAAKAFQAERERLAADPAYAAAQTAQLGEWCDKFVAMKAATGASPANVAYLGQKLGHWIRIHGRSAPLARFADPAVWDDYLKQRRAEEVTLHTISKEAKVMRQMLTSAKRQKRFPGDLSELRPEGLTTSYKPRERALTAAELRKLLSQTSPWLANLVCVTVALGCRLSEALKLDPGDVDLESGTIHIRGTKTKGSDRVVPILSPFRPFIERVLPALPLGPKPNNLRRNLLAACDRAGIDPATPNDFRRTHASILAELGAGEEQVARLLGHASVEMVRKVYAKPRALATGALIESSIGQRSAGVVDMAQNPESSDRDGVAKSTESRSEAATPDDILRIPKPKVARSNRAGGAGSTRFHMAA